MFVTIDLKGECFHIIVAVVHRQFSLSCNWSRMRVQSLSVWLSFSILCVCKVCENFLSASAIVGSMCIP